MGYVSSRHATVRCLLLLSLRTYTHDDDDDDADGADVLLRGNVAAVVSDTFRKRNSAYFVRKTFGCVSTVTFDTSHTVDPSDGVKLERKRANVESALSSCEIRADDVQLATGVVMHTPNLRGSDPILDAVIASIESTTRHVDIRSCYVVLCRPLQMALIRAARRGVRVRILTNSMDTNDLLFIHAAMVQSMTSVARAGASIFVTTTKMDHTKFVLCDREWLCVGSWNAWLRTHFYEAELNCVIRDRALGKRIGTLEFDRLVSIDAIESGRVRRYTEGDLKRESDEVTRKVCGADAFHSKFI